MVPPLPPPGLMDDLIGEILLRLPPEDPECLVHASVVCKSWRRLVSDPSFPRRYREFHGSPPMLGFLYYDYHRKEDRRCCRFVPIKESSPILNHQPEPDCWLTLDCRHGRVLLLKRNTGIIVWDPITNIRLQIGLPETKQYPYYYAAAVLCASNSCDHLDCHGGPSLVVFVATELRIDHEGVAPSLLASASMYSTDTGAWNAGVSSVHLGVFLNASKMIGSSLIARGALYFILEQGWRILKYDLAGRGLTVMSSPSLAVGKMVLMKAEGGGLGACGVEGHNLHLWTWRTGPGGISEWQRGRVIQLDIGDLHTKLEIVDFAEGAGFMFVTTHNGFFAVELKSGRARKIGKRGEFKDIFPFMSFYIPKICMPPQEIANDDDATKHVT